MENLIIGGVLLYITGMIHGRAVIAAEERLRLLVGSIMCGAFSMVIFFNVKAPMLLLMEMLFSVAVCAVVFGRGKKATAWAGRLPWRYALTFLLVTYFMGGIIMGLLLLTDQTGIYTAAGIYTGNMKAEILTLLVTMAAITIKQIINTVKKKKFYEEHVFTAAIIIDGKSLDAKAFLDTGNSLRDPITGISVAVASAELWKMIQYCGISPVRFVMIPYDTVGAHGLLNAIRTDFIEIDGQRIKGCIVAEGDDSFHIAGHAEYDLLISERMVGTGIMP